MKADNVKSQMRKGMLEYCALLILRRNAAYAVDILQQMLETELIVVEGTIYPLLNRLKREGLLTYAWQESPYGPPRKYYALSESGHELLNELDAAWEEIAQSVSQLKAPRNDNTANTEQSHTTTIEVAPSDTQVTPKQSDNL